MNCKACGEPIPSFLLRQDTFKCPNCGKVYRRSTKPSQGSDHTRQADDDASRKDKKQKNQKPAVRSQGTPKWIMPVIAAVLVVALLGCSIWFISKKGGPANSVNIGGKVKMGEIAANKNKNKTIEIPEQPDTNYVIAVESSQIGVICSVKEKTNKSFDIVARNVYSDKRNPTITWALIPFKAN